LDSISVQCLHCYSYDYAYCLFYNRPIDLKASVLNLGVSLLLDWILKKSKSFIFMSLVFYCDWFCRYLKLCCLVSAKGVLLWDTDMGEKFDSLELFSFER
jgi:hypothetical protein